MLSDTALWARVADQSRSALREGGLLPLASEVTTLADAGVTFTVRILTDAAQKAATPAPGHDPFAPPYERSLFVGEVSAAHVAILNKFNVFPEHLLVVTRAFEPQESPLTRADFEAWWRFLSSRDALGFYNAGRRAGASQPHKHMQVLPMPVFEGPSRTALDPALRHGSLPFAFAVAPFEVEPQRAHAAYWRLLREIDCDEPGSAYNFLVTRDFMWAVPRSRGNYDGISVNALGYVGSLAVSDHAALERLRRMGPWRLLTEVARPRVPRDRGA